MHGFGRNIEQFGNFSVCLFLQGQLHDGPALRWQFADGFGQDAVGFLFHHGVVEEAFFFFFQHLAGVVGDHFGVFQFVEGFVMYSGVEERFDLVQVEEVVPYLPEFEEGILHDVVCRIGVFQILVGKSTEGGVVTLKNEAEFFFGEMNQGVRRMKVVCNHAVTV